MERGVYSIKFPEYTFVTTPFNKSSYESPEPLQWDLLIFIRKDDISKYSKFWVEPKPETK